MEILIKAAQLILSLSILIVLHELGHFIPAKLFKTRVEKFYFANGHDSSLSISRTPGARADENRKSNMTIARPARPEQSKGGQNAGQAFIGSTYAG